MQLAKSRMICSRLRDFPSPRAENRVMRFAVCRSWAVLFSMILIGCDKPAPISNLPTAKMKIGSKTYTLEIAADDPSREHGLMERDALDADHGMIFIFAKPSEQNFWMYHTRFPLDIIYVGADKKVVSVSTMKAYDRTQTYSNGLAKYAIEINSGQAAACGIRAGATLVMPDTVLKSEVK